MGVFKRIIYWVLDLDEKEYDKKKIGEKLQA